MSMKKKDLKLTRNELRTILFYLLIDEQLNEKTIKKILNYCFQHEFDEIITDFIGHEILKNVS